MSGSGPEAGGVTLSLTVTRNTPTGLIHNTRNIGDFTRWKRYDAWQKAFARLLRDLQAQ